MEITNDNYKEVIEKNDEVIFKLGAQWCGPCRMIDPIVEKLQKSDTFNYQLYSIDIDQVSEVARAFNVRSIPTVLFFKNGEVVNRLTGAFPESKFINETEKAFPTEDVNI